MNVFDKSLLFEMSYALMRRFAFIEVPSPSDATFKSLIDRWSQGDGDVASTPMALMALRELKDIGPAVFRDIAAFAAARRALSNVDEHELRLQAFYSYLLPQFEGLDEPQGKKLFRTVVALIGKTRADDVRRMLSEVLGLTGLPASASGAEPEESGDDLGVEPTE